eukprot:7487942-Ditylum_brightwellii.AAC.1
MVLHQSIHEIAQFCHSDLERIIIASDELPSKEDNIMTFGWIMVNTEKDILAEHACPAFGQTSSFCVEDDDEVMDKLDLPVKLNVAANCLATWYRLQSGVSCTDVP